MKVNFLIEFQFSNENVEYTKKHQMLNGAFLYFDLFTVNHLQSSVKPHCGYAQISMTFQRW